MRRVPSLFWRYLAGTFWKTSVATVAGVLAVVLVVDFADRAYSFTGPGWVGNVVRLYVNLAADFGYQIAPAALVLAAGITVSALRSQGELTAFLSLGNRPGRMIESILGACAIACVVVVLVNEWVVVGAARRAEEIKHTAFSRKPGDFRAYLEQQKWFRSGDWVYNLRQATDTGFSSVSLYLMDPGFRLKKRIDAGRMDWEQGKAWSLSDVTVSTFDGGRRTGEEEMPALSIELPESLDDLRIKTGKPRQMSLFQLYDQIQNRERLGLEDAEYKHELYNRIAYPFASVPGALIAIRLALRKRRSGHIATSLAEALIISLGMFTLWTAFRAIGVSGGLPPGLAALAPVIILTLVGLAADLPEWIASFKPVPRSIP